MYIIFFQVLSFNHHLSRTSQGYTKRGGWLSSHPCNSGTRSSTWLWVQAAQAPVQNSEGLWLLSLTHHDPTAHQGQLNPSNSTPPTSLLPHSSQSDPGPQLPCINAHNSPILGLPTSSLPSLDLLVPLRLWKKKSDYLTLWLILLWSPPAPCSFNVKWISGSSLVKWREGCFMGLLWELNGIM